MLITKRTNYTVYYQLFYPLTARRLQPLRWEMNLKSVYLIATRDLSNLWLQFFLSQNQGFMRLFEKTVLK